MIFDATVRVHRVVVRPAMSPAALLRLPAFGDNAAVPTEPPKVEPPTPARSFTRWCKVVIVRRFQFSMRRMFVAVGLFCTVASLPI